MTASIVLTGLAASDATPGIFEEINFAQGPSAGYGGLRAILVLANKSTAGSGTTNTVIYGPDTAVPLQTEADMIAIGGPGSEAHRIYRRMALINQVTPIYWLFVPESVGTAASTTCVITGTATANGNLRFWCGDEFVDVGITSGDTPTVIGGTSSVGLQAAINAMTHWPITASNTTGTVTITAKEKGPRGNWIQVMAMVSSPGSITTTVTPTADTYLTSGATADSSTTALATILGKRFYYIVSAADDATQFGALVSQIGTQALPTNGIRQKCFAGSVDTLANTITIATGRNSPRAELIWSQQSDWTPAELAGYGAALYAMLENQGTKPRNNYCNFPSTPTDSALWKVPAPRTASVAPTAANIRSALNNGITPIGVLSTGGTQLVRRITTRSLSGSTNDYRTRDACIVTICDFYGDDLQTKLSLEYGGKDFADNPKQGEPVLDNQCAWPALIEGSVNKLTDEYVGNGLLVNGKAIKNGTIVQRETNPTTRASIQVPLQPIPILAQIAVQLNQVA